MQAKGTRKNSRRGVTLLELLAVIMIAGLLAAVSIPAFNSLLKGTALNTATSSLTDNLALARQVAIANRLLCHVELVDEATPQEQAEGIQDNSYRVYYVDRNGEEITVRDWKLLPRFVEFDLRSSDPRFDHLREIIFKPTAGATARDRLGRNFFNFHYTFKIVHTESGTRGEEKTMTIKVKGITGQAKAEPGDTTGTS